MGGGDDEGAVFAWQRKALREFQRSTLRGLPQAILLERLAPSMIGSNGRHIEWHTDFIDNFYDGLPTYGAYKDRHGWLSRPWADILATLQEPSFGLSRLGSLTHPMMHAAVGEKQGQLHPNDENVWRRVRALVSNGCRVESPCLCNFVGCERSSDATSLRISSLIFTCHQARRMPRAAVQAMSELPNLRALEICGPSGEALPVIPSLMSLYVDGVHPRILEWASQHAHLVSLSLQDGRYAKQESDIALQMMRLCDLRDLRFLRLVHQQSPGSQRLSTENLPECLSKELTILDVRGQGLQAPPVQLELPELRAFIAFGQASLSPELVTEGDVRSQRCEPFFETLLSDDRDWKCKGMNCTFNTFLKLKWPKLEKLWLDANFIQGTIPPSLLDHFPNLVSLDLHDNHLSGSIPANFGERNFVKLQMHHNSLSGEVPPRLWRSPLLEELSVFMNANLTGCAPASLLDGNHFEQVRRAGVLPGTQIRLCDSDSEREAEL